MDGTGSTLDVISRGKGDVRFVTQKDDNQGQHRPFLVGNGQSSEQKRTVCEANRNGQDWRTVPQMYMYSYETFNSKRKRAHNLAQSVSEDPKIINGSMA